MSIIDPRLKYLQSQKETGLPELESTGRFGLAVEAPPSPTVRVLVQFSGNSADLEKKGLEITSTAGDVVAGILPLDKVDALAKVANVSRIESSRPLTRELDVSVPEIRADIVHTGPPGYRGSGVIVGIIDSGIDWQHQSFRRQDGTSRILRLWDQSLFPQGSEQNPTGFSYGVEYTKSDIDSALTSANPAQVVRHRDGDTDFGHGTHVSGISAGDGSITGNGQPAFTYVGLAPEADIIMVANRVTTAAMGDSASTLDAVTYIFNVAASLHRPVVINLSQGDNLGPHDGTSLLERGIDNLLGGKGRAFVKSAGNEGDKRRHASGTINAGGTEQIRFNVPTLDSTDDTIDIWYNGQDRFAFSITPPGGSASAIVTPGSTRTISLPNGNSIFIDSVLNDPNNHDNRIYIQLQRGTASTIQAGNWTINLTGTTVINGQFHAWIERGGIVPTFLAPHINPGCTISVPGTALQVITAASYITKGTGVGSISSFSSRGPTRDGRNAPTIAAPGESIMSTRAQNIPHGTDQYHFLMGTSMSAPHVTGVIALMLQVDDSLTQAKIRQCLTENARSDTFTGRTPNSIWGAGKIDAKAALDCVSPPVTIKFRDEPVTLKFRDEPVTIKALDEPVTLKFRDEPVTIKVLDEPPTLKFRDDPVTIGFRDEPVTIKFRDDNQTLKYSDELGTSPMIDPIKTPSLDKDPAMDTYKPPAGDVINPPIGGGVINPPIGGGMITMPIGGSGFGSEAAPFILATPHHSLAWAQAYPEAFQAMLDEHRVRITEYETALEEINERYQNNRLTSAEMAQANALYQEYLALCADYESLTQGGRVQ